MAQKSAKVDETIQSAPKFAQPILRRIRKAFHQGCPDVVETIKWKVPHFEDNGIVGSMAAFKHHASFGFWKSKLLSDPAGILQEDRPGSMCTCRITTIKQAPSLEVLVAYVAEAASLNATHGAAPRPKSKRRPALPTPKELTEALAVNASAMATFERLSPSHRREYIEWIIEAKRDETKKRRLNETAKWLSEGKSRNWKYDKR